MQCNIDAKGKAARLIYGLILIGVGGVVGGLALAEVVSGWGWWVAAGALAGMGAFSVFEARAGWCVVRAMGFKTRF